MTRLKKKDAILKAAFELFIEKGYLNTKISDVAEKAGIGKGTVYEYFSAKEEILLEALISIVSKDFKKARELVMKENNCRDMMKAYLLCHLELMKKYGSNLPDLTQQMTTCSGSMSAEIQRALKGIIQFQYKLMHDILKIGQDKEEISRENLSLSTALVIGAINQYITLKSHKYISEPAFLFPEVKGAESWGDDRLIHILMEGLSN